MAPGETRRGFIFSKLDEGTKAFNVDIAGESDSGESLFETFTFFIPVPGLNIDHYNVDWENLYPQNQWVDLDSENLIRRWNQHLVA